MGTTNAATRSVSELSRRLFLARHATDGATLALAAASITVGYLGLTWAGPQRPLVLSLVALALALSLGLPRLLRGRLADGPRLVRLHCASSAVGCLLLTVALGVDGGPASPLEGLLGLVFLYNAMAYPPRAVLALGAANLAAVCALGFAVPGQDLRLLAVTAGMIALFTAMTALTARNHQEQSQSHGQLVGHLAALADLDGLTGCLNHRAFHEHLGHEVRAAFRTGQPLSLLVLDLDHFKTLNDSHGHPAGDHVLRAVGLVLRQASRDDDVVGRVGGEEFCVVLPGTPASEAMAVAERLRSDVAGCCPQYPPTVSIGVAVLHDTAADLESLLRQADQAVYEAKGAGRDCVRGWSPAPSAGAEKRTDPGLRDRVLALVEVPGRITAVHQPVVDLRTGDVLGYEALARVPGSHLGPERWLELADEVGLREALEASMWAAAFACGPPPEGRLLFVNATPATLVAGGLQARYPTLPAYVTVEVAEHHRSSDPHQVRQRLATWTDGGVRIAMDDLVSGAVHFADVLALQPHYVKLARELVTNVDDAPAKLALVEALVVFASRTGSLVIAEGVESEADVRSLQGVGVHYGQGWLFGRPQPGWGSAGWQPAATPVLDRVR